MGKEAEEGNNLAVVAIKVEVRRLQQQVAHNKGLYHGRTVT